jgi:GNAT superfamily N-acetyltransferase
MTITKRRYKLLADFDMVGDYLDKQYNVSRLNSYLMRPFWEYGHTHPAFNHKLTHRFGLWEDEGELVGLTCYEDNLGYCFVSVNDDYKHLLPEMLESAEEELSKEENGVRSLAVWTTNLEHEKHELLLSKGYKKVEETPIKIFDYKNEFPEVVCPEGFTVISLEDENDIKKINDCLWKGFNHGDEPDDDLDCRLLMQSGPNFSNALTTIIKAPDGEYACFAGMWINEHNQYAYLEPLATIPKYRKMGLGKLAFVEGMKKTKALGAKYCFGGSIEFYKRVGLETIATRELWLKEWSV